MMRYFKITGLLFAGLLARPACADLWRCEDRLSGAAVVTDVPTASATSDCERFQSMRMRSVPSGQDVQARLAKQRHGAASHSTVEASAAGEVGAGKKHASEIPVYTSWSARELRGGRRAAYSALGDLMCEIHGVVKARRTRPARVRITRGALTVDELYLAPKAEYAPRRWKVLLKGPCRNPAVSAVVLNEGDSVPRAAKDVQ